MPGPGDNVYANNKTVVLDTDVTVTKLSNLAEAGAAQYGRFTVSGSRTITADVEGTTGPSIDSCLEISTPSPGIVNIIGQVRGVALMIPFTGTLNITGNVSSLATNNCYGLRSLGGSSGGVNVTGNVTSPATSHVNNFPIYLQGSPTVVINGNLVSNLLDCIDVTSTGNPTITVTGTTHTQNGGRLFDLQGGNITVTGNLSINSFAAWAALSNNTSAIFNLNGLSSSVVSNQGILCDGTSSFTINGNLVGPNVGSGGNFLMVALSSNSSFTLNGNLTTNSNGHLITTTSTSSTGIIVNGDVTGNNSYNVGAIYSTSTSGNVTVNGTVFGADRYPTILNGSGTLTVRCDKVVGNGYGSGAPVTVGNWRTIALSGISSRVIVKQLEYGSRGNPPTDGATFIDQDPSNSIVMELEDDVTSVTYVPGLPYQDYPAPNEVLDGVTYGFGAFTGEVIQYNVVDTATLITEMKTEGIATVESVGDQVAFFGS